MKTRSLWLGCLLLASVLALGCGEEERPPEQIGCPEGLVRADDGTCQEPEPTCARGVPGSIYDVCRAKGRTCYEDAYGAICGVCLDGYVEDRGECRPVRECVDLDCAAQGRECISGNGMVDARCGRCLPGSEEIGTECIPRTCSPDDPVGSILMQCVSEFRHCVEPGDGEEAYCGECFPGFLEDRGVCRPVRTCEDLGCFHAMRRCKAAEASADAVCGACRAGTIEVGGRCLPLANATCADDGSPSSILEECAAEGRTCVEDAEGARCGECAGDLVEDPRSRECVPFVSCSELDCASENRTCVEDPQGRCAGCLPGFTEDGSLRQCRPVRTCAELRCGPGEECAEATDETDAYCHPECPPGEKWTGIQCAPCPPCDGPGESGVWSAPSATGACICKTLPGYFYSSAGDVGTFPCDADGDGWVRESARAAMESNDPAIRANARCTVLTIDAVRLVNEAGQAKEIPLSDPLELYETDRNDDPAILAVHWSRKALPGYYQDGNIVQAKDLNRFTKLCHDPRADYNDNGVPDVSEWSDHPLGPAMRPEQRPFNHFSYFMELATGHYEAPVGGRMHGTWVIREKPRVGPGTASLPAIALSYPVEMGTYWRHCEVRRDPQWDKVQVPVGMDFAVYSPPGNPAFTGMNHHSLFKCIVVRDQVAPGSTHEFTPAAVAAQGFALNRCRASIGGEDVSSSIECELVDAKTVGPGDVYWGGVPYRDYGPTPYVSPAAIAYFQEIAEKWGASFPIGEGEEGYRGGCINSCEVELPSCPGYDVNPAAVACHRNVGDFGKFAGCTSVELCDGQDNTGSGLVDVQTFEEGYACSVPPEAGGHGECRDGTSRCIAAEVVCVSNRQPVEEICDGLDNDCDGEVDETFPTEHFQCEVPDPNWNGSPNADPYLKGRCRIGRQICAANPNGGASIVCEQTYFPQAESCNTTTDDDCDGNPYTEGGSPENIAGCVNYYFDGDGDGFPDSSVQPKCFCPNLPASERGKYTIREPAGGPSALRWDCCDADARVNPNQTEFFSEPNACGNFEYNCDNKYEEKEVSVVASSCKKKNAGTWCYLETPGWKDAIPACGQSGQYHWDCNFAHPVGSPCNEEMYSKVQRCR